jgi:hypothetical protein
MTQPNDPDFTPFRTYMQAIGVGVSTGYKLVSDGKLRITKTALAATFPAKTAKPSANHYETRHDRGNVPGAITL